MTFKLHAIVFFSSVQYLGVLLKLNNNKPSVKQLDIVEDQCESISIDKIHNDD